MHPTASPFVLIAVSLIAISVAATIAAAHAHVARTQRAPAWPFSLGLGVWIAATGGLAWTGFLTRWDLRPPPFLLLAVISLGAAVALSRSTVGRRLADGLPLYALVAIQAFRLPLELVMHRAAAEGTMPSQMSYSGLNFDIATGVGAIVVALLTWRGVAGARLVHAWNLLGLTLLGVIVAVAVISTPAIAAFGPARLNTWIAYFPFVWMITVNVPAALFVHLVVSRRLRASSPAATADPVPRITGFPARG